MEQHTTFMCLVLRSCVDLSPSSKVGLVHNRLKVRTPLQAQLGLAIKQSRLCGTCKCSSSTNSSSNCITSSSSSVISLECRSLLSAALEAGRTSAKQSTMSRLSKMSKMARSAASARALLAASPIASAEPPAIGERVTEWLKITAVPLLVFLIGACIWSCIKSTAAWRVLTEDGGESTRNEALDEVRSDSPRAISNNEAAEDLETGLELSQVQCRGEGSALVV